MLSHADEHHKPIAVLKRLMLFVLFLIKDFLAYFLNGAALHYDVSKESGFLEKWGDDLQKSANKKITRGQTYD